MRGKDFNSVKPYVYWIKNNITGIKYFGVRWGNITKNVAPVQDLGKKYFTSGKLKKDFNLDKYNNSKESYATTYEADGTIDIYKTKNILKGTLLGNKVLPFVVKDLFSIPPGDIDNLEQFVYVEYLIKKINYKIKPIFIIGVPVESYGPAYLIGSLALFLPSISVAARRLHDVGKSGWWQLIGLTGIGLIPLIIWWAADGGKKYRPSTTRRDDDEPPARESRERSESKFSFGSSRKSGKVDVIDELEELKELYEDGTLSEAQFKKAKKKLLK